MKLLDTKPRAYFYAQMGFATVFTYLTSGVWLSNLAIYMKASDILVSYLSVITNICGVLILMFTVYLNRFKSKKKLTIALTILTKAATFLIVTIPAFVPSSYQLVLFVLVVVIAFTLQAQTTVSLNNWMVDFISADKSGRYISFRQTLSLIVTVILSLTSGYFMDSMQDEYTGFLLLFSFALFMGVLEIILLVRTPDSPFPSSPPEKSRVKLWQAMKKPLKDPSFMRFVFYIVLFYMILNISDSFTNLYMRRYLNLPYTAITMMTLILSLPQIVFLGLWGRISDKLGHQFVLKTSIWLFVGETLFLFLSSPSNCYWLIPAAFFIASIGNAGFIIAVFNRRYELIPPKSRIAYDNLYTAALGAGFILGPLLGGFIKSIFEAIPFVSSLMPIANIRLLYLLSAAGILLLQLIYTIGDKKHAAGRSAGDESPCVPPASSR